MAAITEMVGSLVIVIAVTYEQVAGGASEETSSDEGRFVSRSDPRKVPVPAYDPAPTLLKKFHIFHRKRSMSTKW